MLVAVTVGVLLAGHLVGVLSTVLPAIGTAAAGLLFGYLWLLSLVAAGFVDVLDVKDGYPLTIARTAAAGCGVAVVYLTVVLVVGFVSPTPTPVEPVPAVVARTVVVGAGIGAVSGGLFAAFGLACGRIGRAVADGCVEAGDGRRP